MRSNAEIVFIAFKMALYSCAIVKKVFNSSRGLFSVKIITMKPKAGLLLNTVLCIRPLTFINEVLRLSGSPFVTSTASP